MKKGVIFLMVIAMLSGLVSAECVLDFSLYNQDPYPAIPGEYVKLAIGVDGLSNSECGDVYIELEEKFPISFDSGAERNIILNSGNFISGYDDNALIPFKVKIDEESINDEYEIGLSYMVNYPSSVFLSKKMNITIEDTETLFEVTVNDFDYETNELTFEIINVGNRDVEALTVDVSAQDSFSPKKNTRAIIGGLDSNDDTTFTFEGVPRTGSIIMRVSYNDEQSIRRNVDVSAYFEEALFADQLIELQKPNRAPYYVAGVVVIIALVWIRSAIKRKKKLEQMKARRV